MTAAVAPAQHVLDALADLVHRYAGGADPDQLLDELATVLRRGRAARRRARKGDGRDATPAAANVHPAPSSEQESRQAEAKAAAGATPIVVAGASHPAVKSAIPARVCAAAVDTVNEAADGSGGRGPAASTAAQPALPRQAASPHQDTEPRSGEDRRNNISAAPVPAATAAARVEPLARAAAGTGVEPAPTDLRGLGRALAATPHGALPAELPRRRRRGYAALAVLTHWAPGPREARIPSTAPAPGGDPVRTGLAATVPPGVGGGAQNSAGRPTPARRAGRLRAALVGLAQLVAPVLALAAVLLGASAAGEIAHQDVVPATATGAALLAGLLVGRATAPAVAAAITRRRRRRRTVAPGRVST